MIAYVYNKPLNAFERQALNKKFDTAESIDFSVLVMRFKASPIAMACFLLKKCPKQITVIVTDNTALAAFLATYTPFRFYVHIVRFVGFFETVEFKVPKFDDDKYKQSYPNLDPFAVNAAYDNQFRLDVDRFVQEFRQLAAESKNLDKELKDVLERIGKCLLN